MLLLVVIAAHAVHATQESDAVVRTVTAQAHGGQAVSVGSAGRIPRRLCSLQCRRRSHGRSGPRYSPKAPLSRGLSCFPGCRLTIDGASNKHQSAPSGICYFARAVTRLRGDATSWQHDDTIGKNLAGCSIGFLTLEEMWASMLGELTTTPAPSEIGRLGQLLKAAGLTAPATIAAPAGPAPGSEAGAAEEPENEP